MVLWLKNKKGSHVGIIISFSLFVAFLVFLYSAVEPALETNEEEKNLIQELEEKIINKVSKNFTTITIANSSFNEDCIRFDNYPYSDMNTIVKNSNGEKIRTSFDENTLYIENTDPDGFYRIHSSESSLDNSEMDFEGVCLDYSQEFKRGVHRIEKKVSFQEAEDFIEEYNSDYSFVKKQLDIPEENDFALDFIDNNEVLLETSVTNLTRNIFIGKRGVDYFDNDAMLKGGFLRVKVW